MGREEEREKKISETRQSSDYDTTNIMKKDLDETNLTTPRS
jgi:hypothetical protein